MSRNNSEAATEQRVYLPAFDKTRASLMKLGHSLNRI